MQNCYFQFTKLTHRFSPAYVYHITPGPLSLFEVTDLLPQNIAIPADVDRFIFLHTFIKVTLTRFTLHFTVGPFLSRLLTPEG